MVKVLQKGKEEAPYLIVSQDYFDIQAEGGTVRFMVKGNVPYQVSAGVDWMTRTLSGAAEEEVVFTILPNESTTSREGTITVTSEDGSLVRTVRVIQEGEAVYLEVSPSSISAASEGGRFAFTVNSNTQYTLTSSDTGWINIEGNIIVVAANTSTSQRKGSVTVRAEELVRVIEITQDGKKEETPSAGGSIEDFIENEEDW